MVRDPSIAVAVEALPKLSPRPSPQPSPQPSPPPKAKKSKPAQEPLQAPLQTPGAGAGSAQSRSADGPEEVGPAKSAPRKRKVNTSSKGTAIELAAINILEAEGYKVHRCVRTGVKRGPFWFSQSNDVFGCIDLVAKKRGERTRWIQVTADSGIGRKRKDIEEVPWDPVHDAVEIWRWVGGNTRKHKVTGAFLERQYFQVYRLDKAFVLDKEDRILLTTPAPTPGGTAT